MRLAPLLLMAFRCSEEDDDGGDNDDVDDGVPNGVEAWFAPKTRLSRGSGWYGGG